MEACVCSAFPCHRCVRATPGKRLPLFACYPWMAEPTSRMPHEGALDTTRTEAMFSEADSISKVDVRANRHLPECLCLSQRNLMESGDDVLWASANPNVTVLAC